MRQESIPLTSIRGFAALWVAIYHYQLNMGPVGYNVWAGLSRFGFTGVDVFFILSGFIMAAVYRGLAWRNIGAFFTRRVFRIYPMHLAVLGGMLLLWTDAYLRFGVHNDAQQLRWLPACALLLQPFLYHQLMWNSVTWSISVELVCYLLFPIVIMRLRHAPLYVLLPLIALLCGIEPHLQIHNLAVWGNDALARGLVGFGLGMMLRLASERLPVPSAPLATLGELLAVGGIVVCCAFPEGSNLRIFIPLGAALLILFLSYDSGLVARGLRARWCLWLGKVSYSFYLIHENLIGVVWIRFPATRLPGSHHLGHYLSGLVWTLGVLGLALALSTVTWLLIEEPFRRLGGRIARWMERNHPERARPASPAVTVSSPVAATS